MNCLVVAATAKEINPFLTVLKSGSIGTGDVDVLITGVGIASTTWSLTKQVNMKPPDLVIQAGLCGCFDHKITLGTVFTVKDDCFADLGVVEGKKWLSIFDLELADPSTKPFTKGKLVNKSRVLKKINLKKVSGITINEITTSPVRISLYKKKYGTMIESMEGAAMHYVCLRENIPFIQLRAVSNYAGERNKKNWRLKESIQNLNQSLIKLLTTL